MKKSTIKKPLHTINSTWKIINGILYIVFETSDSKIQNIRVGKINSDIVEFTDSKETVTLMYK